MIDRRSTKVYKLEKENKRLKELCNKYEEEHSTAFKLWTMKMEEIPTYEEKIEMQNEIERLNGFINTMLEFNLFGEECPLNLGYTERCDEEKAQDVFYEDDYCEKTCNDDFKKCWLKYFKRLQELKGSDK